MLKDWDRLETMRSIRKYFVVFEDGSGWTEVDGMLCLVRWPLDLRSEGRSVPPKVKRTKQSRKAPYTASSTRMILTKIHRILVIGTAIKFTIAHSIS